MNEFDKRQLNIMSQKIDAFKTGHLHLHDLIYDLEALLNILESKDQHWKEMFRGYWWDLEQVYSSVLDENKNLDLEDVNIINNAIENIIKLINSKPK
jgi:hypothetical protein